MPGRLSYAGSMTSCLPFSEACERNKAPILKVLGRVLPTRGQILEIGSCTGQHLVFFAPAFSSLCWQPSDQQEYIEGLSARISGEGSPNIFDPIELDVMNSWPDQFFDAVYSSNTAHIMSWESVQVSANASCRVAYFAFMDPSMRKGSSLQRVTRSLTAACAHVTLPRVFVTWRRLIHWQISNK